MNLVVNIPKMKRRTKAPLKLNVNLRKALQASMGKFAFAVHCLMDRPKVPYNIGSKRVTLQPEQLLSLQVADMLRAETRRYQETGAGLRAVWCHVANERKAEWFTMLLLRAMGMLPGAFDYWFVWQGGGGLIELKSGGDMSEFQLYFETWAQETGVNKAVLRSVEAVKEKLIEWGAIV